MVFTELVVLVFVFGLSELFFAVVSSGNDGSADGRGHSMCRASKMGSSVLFGFCSRRRHCLAAMRGGCLIVEWVGHHGD